MSRSLYAGYMTASSGSSMGLFYLGDGILAGVDISGMKYDGTYELQLDGSYKGSLKYMIPSNTTVITGQSATEDTQVVMPLILPAEFWDGKVVRIETPLGLVNGRFEKIKDLP